MTTFGTMRRVYDNPKSKNGSGAKNGIPLIEDLSMTMDAHGNVSIESIEWWYFDAILHNGATIVVIFSTKPTAQPLGPLTPQVRIAITSPNSGTSLETSALLDISLLETNPGSHPVSFGGANNVKSRKKNGTTEFEVHAKAGNLSVALTLTSQTPPVQIGSGNLLFDLHGDKHNFGWRVPVPHGRAKVKYTIDEKTFETDGFGYHDHNWADCPLFALAHDWYWSHARIGCYTVIASLVTPQNMYGGKALPELILIEGEEVITPKPSEHAHVIFSKEQPVNDSLVGAPFAGVLRYEFSDRQTKTKYVATFRRAETTYVESIGPTACYRRFLGSCTLEISHSDQTKTSAISEFLWLGNPPAIAPSLMARHAGMMEQPPSARGSTSTSDGNAPDQQVDESTTG